MNPDEILAALAEVYASCATYRDSGRVVITWLKMEPQLVSIRPFETAFVRPDRFRFEFRDQHFAGCPWDRYIISARNSHVRTWWDVTPGIEEPDSLDLALGGATGVSGGTAHTVPRLLVPNQITGRLVTDLVELVSLSDAPLGDVTCYRLQGRRRPYHTDPAEYERSRDQVFQLTGHRLPPQQQSDDRVLTLWIDRGTFLIRRIEELSDFETDETTGLRTHSIEQITEYTAEMNVAITDHDLRFDPPEESVGE